MTETKSKPVMTEAMKARPVDLRARLPRSLNAELERRAARRLVSKSGYIKTLLLADMEANPEPAGHASVCRQTLIASEQALNRP